jgi:phospholipid N-methyltransferase
MKNLAFIWQYLTKPGTTGAILPSSKYLAAKMVRLVRFKEARVIVEYGPGTGVFTRELIRRRRAETVLLLIERNPDFCQTLRKKFAATPNLHIIEGTAENIGEHLQAHGFTHANFIISGLPFASLPPEVSAAILANTKKFLHEKGRFITFQYTLFKKKIFAKHFKKLHLQHEWRNIPPAYVLTFEK